MGLEWKWSVYSGGLGQPSILIKTTKEHTSYHDPWSLDEAIKLTFFLQGNEHVYRVMIEFTGRTFQGMTRLETSLVLKLRRMVIIMGLL